MIGSRRTVLSSVFAALGGAAFYRTVAAQDMDHSQHQHHNHAPATPAPAEKP